MQDEMERGTSGELFEMAKKDVAQKDGYQMGLSMDKDDFSKPVEQLIIEGKFREAIVNRDKQEVIPLDRLRGVNSVEQNNRREKARKERLERGESVEDPFVPDKVDALAMERMTLADDVIREYNRGILDRDPMQQNMVNEEIEELIR